MGFLDHQNILHEKLKHENPQIYEKIYTCSELLFTPPQLPTTSSHTHTHMHAFMHTHTQQVLFTQFLLPDSSDMLQPSATRYVADVLWSLHTCTWLHAWLFLPYLTPLFDSRFLHYPSPLCCSLTPSLSLPPCVAPSHPHCHPPSVLLPHTLSHYCSNCIWNVLENCWKHNLNHAVFK